MTNWAPDSVRLGEQVAKRMEKWGNPKDHSPIAVGEAGRFEVFDEDGQLLARMVSKRSAVEFVDNQVKLQPYDRDNKPDGPAKKPGVRVECDGKLVHKYVEPKAPKGKTEIN